MTMIERVARAIFSSEYLEDFPDSGVAHALELQKARAAIEAMLQPTEGMLHGGYLSGGHGECPQVPEVWQWMIEAALEGK